MGSRLWRGSRILSLSKLCCIGHLEELPISVWMAIS